MTFSTYWADALGDFSRGKTTVTMPTTYLALYTSNPGVGGSATTNEVSYTGYTRQACGTGGGSIFGAGSLGAASNTSVASFGAISSGSSVTITHVGIVDSSSGAGNLLEFQALGSPVTWATTQTPTFGVSAFTDTFT